MFSVLVYRYWKLRVRERENRPTDSERDKERRTEREREREDGWKWANEILLITQLVDSDVYATEFSPPIELE